MKQYVCNCTAFPWPHAFRLSMACSQYAVAAGMVPRSLLKDTHDFRDTGAPMVKKYHPADWRSWEKWPDYDNGGRR